MKHNLHVVQFLLHLHHHTKGVLSEAEADSLRAAFYELLDGVAYESTITIVVDTDICGVDNTTDNSLLKRHIPIQAA